MARLVGDTLVEARGIAVRVPSVVVGLALLLVGLLITAGCGPPS